MDELAQRIREALAALGGTCEEVAAKLRELGIRGVPGESCACPVYRYLRSLGIPVVNVDGFTVLTSTGLHMVPVRAVTDMRITWERP